MQKSFVRWAAIVLVVAAAGCGQYGGDSPVGATGGDSGGYGSSPGWPILDYEGKGNAAAPMFVGTWQGGSGETWTFRGDASFVQYQPGRAEISGTWSVDGNVVTIDGTAWGFTVSARQLKLVSGGEVHTLVRQAQ